MKMQASLGGIILIALFLYGVVTMGTEGTLHWIGKAVGTNARPFYEGFREGFAGEGESE